MTLSGQLRDQNEECMKKIYKDNGLPFYESSDIIARQYLVNTISTKIIELLLTFNRSWVIKRIEAPTMIPNNLVSQEYTNDDIYITQDFTLKPETTNTSYAYAEHLILHQELSPPFCIWQASKSYRRENDQVSANMRFKEFYQMEFQCIVSEGTKMDYQELTPQLSQCIQSILAQETRIVDSDRLPSYSMKTIDIEVKTPHKWLEVCSVSKRNDVPFTWQDKRLLNYEFAFGLDRLTNLMNN